jgi:3-dehydroquinate dehydratase type I
MKKPRICGVITNNDPKALKEAEPFVDLFEVRIDLVGDGWQELVRQIDKPWIACNRIAEEGGKWQGTEARRIEQLLQAIELGAAITDIEITTKNLENVVKLIKKRSSCLLSFHNFEKTPPLVELKEIVQRQLGAGADICKVITTARRAEDNITALQLILEFTGVRLVSFTMGAIGTMSRVLCPLVGGEFTYASIGKGIESAEGQLTATELRMLYGMMRED